MATTHVTVYHCAAMDLLRRVGPAALREIGFRFFFLFETEKKKPKKNMIVDDRLHCACVRVCLYKFVFCVPSGCTRMHFQSPPTLFEWVCLKIDRNHRLQVDAMVEQRKQRLEDVLAVKHAHKQERAKNLIKMTQAAIPSTTAGPKDKPLFVSPKEKAMLSLKVAHYHNNSPVNTTSPSTRPHTSPSHPHTPVAHSASPQHPHRDDSDGQAQPAKPIRSKNPMHAVEPGSQFQSLYPVLHEVLEAGDTRTAVLRSRQVIVADMAVTCVYACMCM
jgi:hypothetical protein